MLKTIHEAPVFSGGSFKPPVDALYDLGAEDLGWLYLWGQNAGQSEIRGDWAVRGELQLLALATPAAPTITNVGTAGATTYTYVVTATVNGKETAASAAGSTATGNAALSGVNYNVVTWVAVPGATGYKVYRTVGGATQGLISTVATGLTLTLNDTGLAGGGETAPTTNNSGSIQLAVGLAANPSLTFAGDLDTGLYWVAANNFALAMNGIKMWDFATNRETRIYQSVTTADLELAGYSSRGTVAAPTISITGDPCLNLNGWGYSGAAYVQAAQIQLMVEGTVAATRVPGKILFRTGTDAAPSVMTTRLTINSAGLATFTGVVALSNGTVALPALTPASDPDSGLYVLGANNLGLALGGVKSLDLTAGTFKEFNAGGNQAVYSGYGSRGTVASPLATTSGDGLLELNAYGMDANAGSYVRAAYIQLNSAGTIASTRVAGVIKFFTSTDAAPSVETLRLTIDQAGKSTFTGNMVFSGLAAAGAGTTLVIDGSNNIIPLASQSRFKSSQRALELDAALVYRLQPKSFQWNSLTTTPGEEDFGLIAEEVATVIPELVIYHNDKPFSVKYDRLAVLLLPELARLRKRVEELEAVSK